MRTLLQSASKQVYDRRSYRFDSPYQNDSNCGGEVRVEPALCLYFLVRRQMSETSGKCRTLETERSSQLSVGLSCVYRGEPRR